MGGFEVGIVEGSSVDGTMDAALEVDGTAEAALAIDGTDCVEKKEKIWKNRYLNKKDFH